MTEESRDTYRRMLSLPDDEELPQKLINAHDRYQRLADTMQNPFPYALHFVVIKHAGCLPALPEPAPTENKD